MSETASIAIGEHQHPSGLLTVEKWGDGWKVNYRANNWGDWSADWFFLGDGTPDGTGTELPGVPDEGCSAVS